MLLSEVLRGEIADDIEYATIAVECSDFIIESNGIPMYKVLPTDMPPISRIKIRHKRGHQSVIENAFGSAFTPNLRQRALFAQAHIHDVPADHDLYYVFPTNGYKYLFSDDVENSYSTYNTVCESLLEQLDEDEAVNIIKDMLKITYQTTNLQEGLTNNAEILFYNIPAYYVVRSSHIDFDKLISIINKK